MNESRVPSGVPTGGQFAASARAEADVALTPSPRVTAESATVLAQDAYRSMHRRLDSFISDRDQGVDNSSTRYDYGMAQAHATALVLLRGDISPTATASEIAWAADNVVSQATADSTRRPEPGWKDASRDIQVDALDDETACAMADALVKQALAGAASGRAAVEHGDAKREGFTHGLINMSLSTACALRDGTIDPRNERVQALCDAVRAYTPPERLIRTVEDPDDDTLRAIYEDAFPEEAEYAYEDEGFYEHGAAEA